MIPYIKTHRENKYNLASIQELRKRSNKVSSSGYATMLSLCRHRRLLASIFGQKKHCVNL